MAGPPFGIVLAAGGGSRMGRPKMLLPVGGHPLLQHVVDAGVEAGLRPLAVVLGAGAAEVAVALRLPPGAAIVRCPDWAEGQSASLRAGLTAAPPDAGAAVILLGDQPEVRPEAVRALLEARRLRGAPAARAAYRGRPGHPVLLGRETWPALMRLRGDAGARGPLAALPGGVELVEVGGDPPADVDTPEDYARLLERTGASPAQS